MIDDHNSHPLVSVCCCTYNHEKFIAQCLEGFVMQKTNFRFEVLVHDDASTDKTSSIVRKYEEQYPSLFHCVYQSENQFYKQNTLINILFKAARGKYLSLCEGDDYWTDPNKLQKQVDFLEMNLDYAGHCHNALVERNGLILREYNGIKDARPLSNAEILTSLSIPTASFVFRNIYENSLPEIFKKLIIDLTIFYTVAQHGKIHYSPEVMSVYRVHDGGFWTSQGEFAKINKAIEINDKLINHLTLSKDEKRAVTSSIVHLRHNRIKSHANRFQFGVEYFKDVWHLVIKKAQGYDVRIKFLIFCMLPNRVVHWLKPRSREVSSEKTYDAA